MRDARIVELYWKRSERAIEESRKKYGPYCNAVAWNILHSHEDADECEWDTYQRAWQAMPDARPGKRGAFLGKIARNCALMRWRKTRAAKRGNGQVALALDELEECIPEGRDLDKLIDSEVIGAVLTRFIVELPDKQREVFVQRYWYLRSISEIADDLGISKTNVTTMLGRVRAQLKTALEKEGVEL